MVLLNSDTKESEKIETKPIIFKAPVLQYHERRRFGCWGCFILVVIFVCVVGGGIAYLLARSGLVHVPVLTSSLYQPVSPTRVVEVSPEAVENIEQNITDDLTEQAIDQQKDLNPENLVMTFEVAEDQLTALAIKNFSNLDMQEMGLTLQNPQIVVTDNFIELYCQVIHPAESVILLQFVPQIKNSAIDLLITRSVVGNLSIPSSSLNYLVDKFLEDNMNTLVNNMLANHGTIQAINLSDAKISVGISGSVSQ